MEKKITIYTVTSGEVTKSFTTKKLATDAQNTLKVFGIESEVKKESTTVTLD